MNIEELKQKLIKEEIDSNDYRINGIDNMPDCKYILNVVKKIFKKKYYEIYFSERGRKFNYCTFEVEEDACKYFYELLMRLKKFKMKAPHNGTPV